MIDVCTNQNQAEISRHTGQGEPQYAINAATSSPPTEAVLRFERVCEKDTDADHSKEQHHAENSSAHNPLGMTHPLDGMFLGAPASSPAVRAEGSTTLEDAASTLWGKLSERILVAETPQGGHEVRITVGQDILPGTEISLTRYPDGGLTAVLITDNAATLQTLVAGRDDLRHRLENMGEKNVRVDVRTSTGDNSGDMDRRSRGLIYPDPEVES